MSWCGVATRVRSSDWDRQRAPGRQGVREAGHGLPTVAETTAQAARRRVTHPQRQLRPGALREGDADGAAHEVGVVNLLDCVLQARSATGASTAGAGRGSRHSSALCLWVARSPAHWNRARLWLLGSPSQVSTPPTTSPPRTEPLPASAAGTATGRLRGAPRLPGAAWAGLQSVFPPRAHLCVTLVEEAHEREAAGLAGGVVLQPERAAGVREGSWGRRACAHRGAC